MSCERVCEAREGESHDQSRPARIKLLEQESSHAIEPEHA